MGEAEQQPILGKLSSRAWAVSLTLSMCRVACRLELSCFHVALCLVELRGKLVGQVTGGKESRPPNSWGSRAKPCSRSSLTPATAPQSSWGWRVRVSPKPLMCKVAGDGLRQLSSEHERELSQADILTREGRQGTT